MNAVAVWSDLPLACPDCRAPVELDGDEIVCAAGHRCGRIDDGVPSFVRERSGLSGALVEFWNSSEEYYEKGRSLNEDYDDVHHDSHRRAIDWLRKVDARRVLDVGCGTGEVSEVLAVRHPGVEYVGVDVSTAAVRAAVVFGRRGAFLAADAERLPFADGSFDGVVSLYALEHFTQPRESLTEMARVLRPGGVLAVLSLSYDRPLGTIPSVRYGLVWRGRKLPSRHPANVAVYAFNRARFGLRQALKHVRYALDPSYLSFERVEQPLVLEGGWDTDLDSVHVVSGRSVLRLLRAQGLEVVDTSIPEGALSGFRVPLDFRVIARKPPR